MVAVVDAVALISAISDVLDGMADAEDKATERERKQLSANLCHALRAIYFAPDGALKVLSKIATGDPIAEAEFNKHIRDFADEDETIRRALLQLDRNKLQRELKVSLKSINALDKIKSSKAELRQLILCEFYRFRRKFSQDQVEIARTLVSTLNKLNSTIERAEERLNIQALDR
jgi:hypothetical protein